MSHSTCKRPRDFSTFSEFIFSVASQVMIIVIEMRINMFGYKYVLGPSQSSF